MSKKKEETGLEGFDALSREDFISSITSDAGSTAMSNSAATHDSEVGMEDKGADALLNALKKREKEVVKEIAEGGNEEEEEEENEEKPDEAPESSEEDKESKPEDKSKKEQKGKEEKKAEEFTFKNPDETKPPAPADKPGYSWKDVAKEFKMELKEDTLESFKEAFEAKSEVNLTKFKPETQRLIKFTEAGGSIDDFVQPFSKIDAAMALSDADLVDEHLKLTGWNDDERREAKLQRMVEDGEVDIVAGNLRKELNNYRETIKNDIIEKRTKAQEAYDKRSGEARIEEAKVVKQQLDGIKEFMMTSVSDDNRAYIAKKFEAGGYESDFKDPKVLAEFFLWKEFGKTGMQNIQTKIKREVEREYLNDRHNVPPRNGKAGSVVKATPSGQDPEGNFDVLDREKIQTSAEE